MRLATQDQQSAARAKYMAGAMQSDHRLHDGLVRERPYIGPEAAHLAQLLKRRAYFQVAGA
jgi:hypothetical protein